MEPLTCAIYINVNKLQYDMFLKTYQSCTNTLNISNGIAMSLLPSCHSASRLHTRVNYPDFVWIENPVCGKWQGHKLTTTLLFCPRDYTQRVNYQDFVWIHSHENKHGLPYLDKSGWKIIGRKLSTTR